MSTGDHDKPTSRQLHVTEGVLGKNEMSKVRRRKAVLDPRGASETDLRVFRERLGHNEQAETLSRLLDDSYVAALEKRLNENGYPPIRGWVQVHEDHSWDPLPDDFSARLAAGHDTLKEGCDPNTGLRIEVGLNYTKWHAEPLSLPWWFAHLGDLIMTIRSEPDPQKLLVLVFTLGRDYQRYMDQQGHLANAVSGHKHHDNTALGRDAYVTKMKEKARPILAEIDRLRSSGHSISRACDVAAKNGYGTSHQANRALFYRYQK